jgi:hypothetical protein
MPQWYDATSLRHCLVYTLTNESTNKYILFGPDLSKFKSFDNMEDLVSYATSNNLTLQFK